MADSCYEQCHYISKRVETLEDFLAHCSIYYGSLAEASLGSLR